MVLSLLQAQLLVIVGLFGLFFRYKDESPAGSALASITCILMFFMLLGGYSYDTGAKTLTYFNATTYDVAHSCVDIKNESWEEFESDGSDCAAGQITETGTFRRGLYLASEAPVSVTVTDITATYLSIVCLALAALFAADFVSISGKKR